MVSTCSMFMASFTLIKLCNTSCKCICNWIVQRLIYVNTWNIWKMRYYKTYFMCFGIYVYKCKFCVCSVVTFLIWNKLFCNLNDWINKYIFSTKVHIIATNQHERIGKFQITSLNSFFIVFFALFVLSFSLNSTMPNQKVQKIPVYSVCIL